MYFYSVCTPDILSVIYIIYYYPRYIIYYIYCILYYLLLLPCIYSYYIICYIYSLLLLPYFTSLLTSLFYYLSLISLPPPLLLRVIKILNDINYFQRAISDPLEIKFSKPRPVYPIELTRNSLRKPWKVRIWRYAPV